MGLGLDGTLGNRDLGVRMEILDGRTVCRWRRVTLLGTEWRCAAAVCARVNGAGDYGAGETTKKKMMKNNGVRDRQTIPGLLYSLFLLLFAPES